MNFNRLKTFLIFAFVLVFVSVLVIFFANKPKESPKSNEIEVSGKLTESQMSWTGADNVSIESPIINSSDELPERNPDNSGHINSTESSTAMRTETSEKTPTKSPIVTTSDELPEQSPSNVGQEVSTFKSLTTTDDDYNIGPMSWSTLAEPEVTEPSSWTTLAE